MIRLLGMLGAVVLAGLSIGSAAVAADPTFGVMNAAGGIYWRSAPDWNTPVAISGNGVYPNSVIAVHCYQSGAANVPGSSDNMWERATVVGGSGSGSGWINEHFINDGQSINHPSPGVPPCAAAPPPPPPPPPGLPAGEFRVQNASGGIYWRSAPDWNAAEAVPGNGVYPDTIIRVSCYQSGAANVPGSADSMWERATVVGGSGSGSGWINEHFINDGQPINQPSPGIPPCGSGGTPQTAPVPVQPPPTSPTAADEFRVRNAAGGIYWRSAPDWNAAEAVPGNGVYPDTIIRVSCYQSGAANVPGSADSMWEQASWAGGQGTGHGWINEHFIDDGQAINQPSPGVPRCNGSNSASPGSGGPATSSNGLHVDLAVIGDSVVPDPGPSAYVQVKVTVTDAAGGRVADAAVTLSNARPGAVFHTNRSGALTLTEGVSVQQAASEPVSLRATAVSGGRSGWDSQQIYSATMETFCSFKGRPGRDLSALDDLDPTRGSWLTLLLGSIDAAARKISNVRTQAIGWRIDVPHHRPIYAQAVTLFDGDTAKETDVGYSTKRILSASAPLDALEQAGCHGPIA